MKEYEKYDQTSLHMIWSDALLYYLCHHMPTVNSVVNLQQCGLWFMVAMTQATWNSHFYSQNTLYHVVCEFTGLTFSVSHHTDFYKIFLCECECGYTTHKLFVCSHSSQPVSYSFALIVRSAFLLGDGFRVLPAIIFVKFMLIQYLQRSIQNSEKRCTCTAFCLLFVSCVSSLYSRKSIHHCEF